MWPRSDAQGRPGPRARSLFPEQSAGCVLRLGPSGVTVICLHHTLSLFLQEACLSEDGGGGGAVPSRGPSSCRPGVGGGAGPLRASLRMVLPRTHWVTVCVPPACFCSVPASALARRPLRQFGLELGSLPWLCGSAPCPRLCPGGAHGRGQQPQSRRSARFPAALT